MKTSLKKMNLFLCLTGLLFGGCHTAQNTDTPSRSAEKATESSTSQTAQSSQHSQPQSEKTIAQSSVEKNAASAQEPEFNENNDPVLASMQSQSQKTPQQDSSSPDKSSVSQAAQPAPTRIVYPVTRSVQENGWYCGPAVMQMLLSHYGLEASQSNLAQELNTSSVTGTEYADLARVASVHVFGAEVQSDEQPGFRPWIGKTGSFSADEQSTFLRRLKRDMDSQDVLSAAVDVSVLYPSLNISAAHVVLIDGIEVSPEGEIQKIRIEDPSYLIEYENEEEHWFDINLFLRAMDQCAEPGYIW